MIKILKRIKLKNNILINNKINKSTIKLRKNQRIIENENEYMFGIVRKTKIMENDGFKQGWPSERSFISDDKVQEFIKESVNPGHLEDVMYEDMIHGLVELIPTLPEHDVIQILAALNKWADTGSMNSKHYKKLWKSIDYRLTRILDLKEELNQKELKKFLDISTLWYLEGLSKFCKFNAFLIKKIIKSDLNIDLDDFMHLMFIISLTRTPMDAHLSNYVEQEVHSRINQLSIQELGLIGSTFVKTGTKIKKPHLINSIATAVIKLDYRKEDHIGMAAIIKFLRDTRIESSSNYDGVNINKSTKQFIEHLIKFSDKLSVSELVHLNLLQHKRYLVFKDLFDVTVKKISDSGHEESLRLKDIAKFMVVYGKCNQISVNHKDQLDKIIEIVESKDHEIDSFPRCLVSFLLGLSILEIYPPNLIEKCFDPQFLQLLEG